MKSCNRNEWHEFKWNNIIQNNSVMFIMALTTYFDIWLNDRQKLRLFFFFFIFIIYPDGKIVRGTTMTVDFLRGIFLSFYDYYIGTLHLKWPFSTISSHHFSLSLEYINLAYNFLFIMCK